MLEVARRCLGQRARLRLDDAARLPYPDRAFDLVLASAVLHEMPLAVRAATLGEMARVLQPGGRLAGQGQPAVAYAMISNATDPPTRRARCTSGLRRTLARRKPAGALTPTGRGAQNGRIWAALVLTAIQPAATQNGGSRAGLRLRSVTDYGYAPPPGLGGQAAAFQYSWVTWRRLRGRGRQCRWRDGRGCRGPALADSGIPTVRIPRLGAGPEPPKPFSSSMRLKRVPPAASTLQRVDSASDGKTLETCLVTLPQSGGAERYSAPTITC
jgi:hypothetical protein